MAKNIIKKNNEKNPTKSTQKKKQHSGNQLVAFFKRIAK